MDRFGPRVSPEEAGSVGKLAMVENTSHVTVFCTNVVGWTDSVAIVP